MTDLVYENGLPILPLYLLIPVNTEHLSLAVCIYDNLKNIFHKLSLNTLHTCVCVLLVKYLCNKSL